MADFLLSNSVPPTWVEPITGKFVALALVRFADSSKIYCLLYELHPYENPTSG